MALVTVQRSPSVTSTPTSSENGSSECLEDVQSNKSLSEYYFAVKGFAVLLPKKECQQVRRQKRSSVPPADIQSHLQAILHLLRSGDTLQMAVRLESVHVGRTRYLAVVSAVGRNHDNGESCILGVDFSAHPADQSHPPPGPECPSPAPTIGLALPVLADTNINLDGDGGFSVSSAGRKHIFKPISVQAMWSALQTVNREASRASEHNLYPGGVNHDWTVFYHQNIASDQSRVNEWNFMEGLESRRPPSPDSITANKAEIEMLIKDKLKEIMTSVNIDEVTSKYIRQRLEDDLTMDLFKLKSFIDREMLVILGQMDSSTEIFPHVFLGSEWNASNLQELRANGIGHILNVTREIDNFFPGRFDYLNIRVCDDENTELLPHWEHTYKYIARASSKGSKVLVHCKMGISRSASVVMAYAMKAFGMSLAEASEYVKKKRSCVKPNKAFFAQLKIYEGILDASRQRHNVLFLSKSESNLKGSLSSGRSSFLGDRQGSALDSGAFPSHRHDSSPSSASDDSDKPLFPLPRPSRPRGSSSGLYQRRPRSWSPSDAHAAKITSLCAPSHDLDSLRKSFSLNEKTWEGRVTAVQHHLRPPDRSKNIGLDLAEAVNPFCSIPRPSRLSGCLPEAPTDHFTLTNQQKKSPSYFDLDNLKCFDNSTSVGSPPVDGLNANNVDASKYWSSTVYVSPAGESSLAPDNQLAIRNLAYPGNVILKNGDTHVTSVAIQDYHSLPRPVPSNPELDSRESKDDSKVSSHKYLWSETTINCQRSDQTYVHENPQPLSNFYRRVISVPDAYLKKDSLNQMKSSKSDLSGSSISLQTSCPEDIDANLNKNLESRSTPSSPSDDAVQTRNRFRSGKQKSGFRKLKSSPQTPEHEIPLPGTVRQQMRKLERYLKQFPNHQQCCSSSTPLGRSFSSGCVCPARVKASALVEARKTCGITRSSSDKRPKTASELEKGTVRSLTRALESTRPDGLEGPPTSSRLKRTSHSMKQKSRRSKSVLDAGFHRSQSLEIVAKDSGKNSATSFLDPKRSQQPLFSPAALGSMSSSQELLSCLVERTEAQLQQLERDERRNEINVKNLVGLFEDTNEENASLISSSVVTDKSQSSLRRLTRKSDKFYSSHKQDAVRPRSEHFGEAVLPPIPLRKSSLDYVHSNSCSKLVLDPALNLASRVQGPAKTISSSLPVSVTANGNEDRSSLSSSNRNPCSSQVRLKKQQGKTHPLSKLVPRHNLL